MTYEKRELHIGPPGALKPFFKTEEEERKYRNEMNELSARLFDEARNKPQPIWLRPYYHAR